MMVVRTAYAPPDLAAILLEMPMQEFEVTAPVFLMSGVGTIRVVLSRFKGYVSCVEPSMQEADMPEVKITITSQP